MFTTCMLDLRSKNRMLLLVPGAALVFFLVAFFYYYRGVYRPPPPTVAPLSDIVTPLSAYSVPEEVTLRPRQGRVVAVDAAHRNRFSMEEIAALEARVAERGYQLEPFGGFGSLDEGARRDQLAAALRRADSLVVAMPGERYSSAEVGLVQQFVAKGGRLLLVGDPTRESQINSLAGAFGIAFQNDYLYSLADYELNFQYIRVRSFQPDELTQGLKEVALYSASSIISLGPALASADGQTKSTLSDSSQPFPILVRGNTGQVVALADMTFMLPPQNSVLDNGRLMSNLAAYLTTHQRQFELADYPGFLRGEVQVVATRPELFSQASKLRSQLAKHQVASTFRREEDLSHDAVIIGLFDDAPRVATYLDGAGVRVGATVGTASTGQLPRDKTGVLVLHAGNERNVLVVLADSPDTLDALVGRLGPDGDYRSGLVDQLVGVYRP